MAFSIGWRPGPWRHPLGHWLMSTWTDKNQHSVMVCNCSRAVWNNIFHLDSRDISNNSVPESPYFCISDGQEEGKHWLGKELFCRERGGVKQGRELAAKTPDRRGAGRIDEGRWAGATLSLIFSLSFFWSWSSSNSCCVQNWAQDATSILLAEENWLKYGITVYAKKALQLTIA